MPRRFASDCRAFCCAAALTVAAPTMETMNNLLNPKAGAIFATALPQFVNRGDGPFRLALMMVAYEAILLVWLNVYGCVVSRARQSWISARAHRFMERTTGAVLVALATRLALEHP